VSERKPERRPGEGRLAIEERIRPKKPRMYGVVLLNDDYTPMEFVVWVLRVVFHKHPPEATRLMLDVHNKGKGLCGVFTYDVARSKAVQVERLAAKHEYPLKCCLEAVETE
jgi:ATP-dependent Clp protease adaptor protein ClpS